MDMDTDMGTVATELHMVVMALAVQAKLTDLCRTIKFFYFNT